MTTARVVFIFVGDSDGLKLGPARLAVGVVILLGTSKASALQPLSELLEAARRHNPELRESAALNAQREQEASRAKWRLAPTFTAIATYMRNEYAATVSLPALGGQAPRTVTITPRDQMDAILSVSVPLIDVALWNGIAASNASASAERARSTSVRLDIDMRVAQAFYRTLAGEALLDAGDRSLGTAEASLRVVRQRAAAGTASALDVSRAVAEVEARRQDVAAADFALQVARRSLETLTGVTPSVGGRDLEDDLREEAGLPMWEARADALPAVAAARQDARAAEAAASAERALLYPTAAGVATERFTNATAFGQSHAAWQQVRTQLSRARAARVELEANRTALSLARQRYEAGTATMLDVLIAERDAFSAEGATIQSNADLGFARVSLRFAAGLPFEEKTE